MYDHKHANVMYFKFRSSLKNGAQKDLQIYTITNRAQ